MKVLYRPLSLLVSTGGALLAGAVFRKVWRLVSGEDEAPQPTDRRFSIWEVVAAAAMQGAVAGAVRAAVDRAGAAGYEKATGSWPGDDGDE
ncbi:hypothetical protein SacmaDRAFT_1549 [Saccharomonospora marina XMU15]|uniref:DUF4235 domain-containing protein n=1 Tax=Saccharomonospora marina XMU15 TaxID=882083 RepID=H5X2G0_9PSEU|nr:DUF4235 domain-containing protein [Saccharomonospora marina]EHR49825.1 hypothetical protein SacmaDRAFT_1549 [Saccharomonospora marina XMU15]